MTSSAYFAAFFSPWWINLSREDGDKTESDSIANQRTLLEAYAIDHPELCIVDEFVDDGYSGSNFERPAFQNLFRELEQGIINCVLVKDLSRFGRNYIEVGRYLERIFPVMRVRLIAVTDNYDSQSAWKTSDALTGDTSQECMFILYGATSRNGKGTAMETFLKIMGDYGKTSNPDMLATKFRGGNTGGPSEEVARLVGARFVNISEPEKKITFNAALVKRMTGNDTINARFLNENSFDFVPVFKIFINTNYLPNVNDMTLFQSGRLKIIPFNRHFEEGEQDQGLKGQFAKTENLSGIFNWCLEGYKKFCQQGLDIPDAVKTATEDYKDDSDRIGQFIEAWIEKDENAELRTSAAYQLYSKWCEENGYSSENQKNFKNAIGVHFKIMRKRPKDGGGQTTMILGCKFREVEEGAEEATVQEAYKPKDALI